MNLEFLAAVSSSEGWTSGRTSGAEKCMNPGIGVNLPVYSTNQNLKKVRHSKSGSLH
jgi:hypothetical protein